jgi:hypothetical protein
LLKIQLRSFFSSTTSSGLWLVKKVSRKLKLEPRMPWSNAGKPKSKSSVD